MYITGSNLIFFSTTEKMDNTLEGFIKFKNTIAFVIIITNQTH